MLVGILCNEDKDSSKKWEIACKNMQIPNKVIDITQNSWLEKITSEPFDFFLLRPPGLFERFKVLYDERIYIIAKILNNVVFPSYEETLIYENKRMLSYFLNSSEIPHPETSVFYTKEVAKEFINKTVFPIVAKTNIGAAGSGIDILKNTSQAQNYIKVAFSNSGIKRRFGPNRVTGTPIKWFKKAIKSPNYFKKKFIEYVSIYKDGQKGYVIFQQFIPHNFEWRAVKIGESYFAHKKIKYKDKASGSKEIVYVNPPIHLLNFIKKLCYNHNFNFMAVDLFEDGNNGFLVNELQTIFGHVQDHILEVDGTPGRYLYKKDQWIFEQGNFNTNESFDLRLKVAIELYEQHKL